ncbi:hypothetical protein V6N13_136242 [Hibiscus sabdariffa]
MASLTLIFPSHTLLRKPSFNPSAPSPNLSSSFVPRDLPFSKTQSFKLPRMATKSYVVSASTAEMPRKRYPGEAKGFVEEMRFVAMKLHTREQAKEGEKEVKQPEERSVRQWEPTIDGYLKFLVDSRLVYDTLESIVDKATFPIFLGVVLMLMFFIGWFTLHRLVHSLLGCSCFAYRMFLRCATFIALHTAGKLKCMPWSAADAEFKNTGLERLENLANDLKWFEEQGYAIPGPSSPGVTYAEYLKEISENDPQAFICHFYNTYFAHSAGGRMIGRKVAEKLLNNKVLEFYKWDGDLSQLLQNVRDKLNKVSEVSSVPLFVSLQNSLVNSRPPDSYLVFQSWTREEKNHCLEETEKSFKHSGDILRLILS